MLLYVHFFGCDLLFDAYDVRKLNKRCATIKPRVQFRTRGFFIK